MPFPQGCPRRWARRPGLSLKGSFFGMSHRPDELGAEINPFPAAAASAELAQRRLGAGSRRGEDPNRCFVPWGRFRVGRWLGVGRPPDLCRLPPLPKRAGLAPKANSLFPRPALAPARLGLSLALRSRAAPRLGRGVITAAAERDWALPGPGQSSRSGTTVRSRLTLHGRPSRSRWRSRAEPCAGPCCESPGDGSTRLGHGLGCRPESRCPLSGERLRRGAWGS